VFTVRLRGVIEGSRLQLFQTALRRRDTSQQALGRPVALKVDIDSPGGQVFAALEIGRLLRREAASARVGQGLSAQACVPAMGATSARLLPTPVSVFTAHRLGDPRRDTRPCLVGTLAALRRGDGRLASDRRCHVDPREPGTLRHDRELARYGLSVSIVR
jgi:hypothetical protein